MPEETTILNSLSEDIRDHSGLAGEKNMQKYEPFDLKIGKLTGTAWNRDDMNNLSHQLIVYQGSHRSSIENRIIILFDKSQSSSLAFFQKNRSLIMIALYNIARNPYAFTHWIDYPNTWCSLVLIEQGSYQLEQHYYEHPLGPGLREPDKAQFEFNILKEISRGSGGLIKYNPDPKVHGYDGDILLDANKICNPVTHPPLYWPIPVCDYGTPPVPNWQNCLPCPLYSGGNCMSRGGIIWRAIHGKE
jgi:hypothetical protein